MFRDPFQVRFGVLQAGCFGVAQSRKRAFIWAAAPGETLPDWPTSRHVFASSQLNISMPGGNQYSAAGDRGAAAPLRSVTVRDSIQDLPPVTNGAAAEEMKVRSDLYNTIYPPLQTPPLPPHSPTNPLPPLSHFLFSTTPPPSPGFKNASGGRRLFCATTSPRR